MTEQRLARILRENGCTPYEHEHLMKAMNQAVNESIDEAARIAMDNMLPKTSEEITNLKVK